MRRNAFTNTSVVGTAINKNMSEYKIGHTTYLVKLHFNTKGEGLKDLLNRLIGKSVERKSAA